MSGIEIVASGNETHLGYQISGAEGLVAASYTRYNITGDEQAFLSFSYRNAGLQNRVAQVTKSPGSRLHWENHFESGFSSQLLAKMTPVQEEAVAEIPHERLRKLLQSAIKSARAYEARLSARRRCH